MTTTTTAALDGSTPGELAPEMLDELSAVMEGTLHLPGSPGYAALATPWNVAVPVTAVAVAEVADADDVSAVLRFAAAHGLEVDVRCTGHGALAHDKPTLLINPRRLDELSVRPDGFARVGAGVRWAQVLEAGAPHGLAGLSGSSPQVGVVGSVTGGAVGPVARTFGFASDHVVAFDLVTGDGVVRRASAEENPDLFWALRGGKGAVGVVMAVELELFPLAELYAGCLYFDGADLPAVLRAWRDWAQDLPDQGSTSLAVMRLPPLPSVPPPLAGRTTVAVRFAWAGDPADGAAVIAPMEAVAPVVLGGTGPMPYAALAMIHADPTDPMPAMDDSRLLTSLPDEALDVLLAHVGPEATTPLLVLELRRMGGAISRPPEVPSAMSYRDAAYGLNTIGILAPPIAAATLASSAAVLDAMAAWSDGTRLPNFGMTTDLRDFARSYDPETLSRLAAVCAEHDPAGALFSGRLVREAAALG